LPTISIRSVGSERPGNGAPPRSSTIQPRALAWAVSSKNSESVAVQICLASSPRDAALAMACLASRWKTLSSTLGFSKVLGSPPSVAWIMAGLSGGLFFTAILTNSAERYAVLMASSLAIPAPLVGMGVLHPEHLTPPLPAGTSASTSVLQLGHFSWVFFKLG